ncbi:MAG: MCM family protein, partial [Nanoarchaeota archaeon]|nr:MCM family protein [Nanoarchaeota archaeon]
ISASQRSHIIVIKEIISELENKIGKTIPIEDITGAAREKGIDSDKVDEIIEKLRRSGDIFEPRRGFVQKL